MKAAIGIDVGGTKVALVLGTEKGKILVRREFSTPTGKRAKEALPQIKLIVSDFLTIAKLKNLKVSGIGAGLPGAVNAASGRVPYSPNLAGWEKLPFRKSLEQTFKLPVYLANDANAAACAERVFGTAKKSENFVYITVSTGVGGGIFVNGKLIEGAGFAAGEVGHIPVVPGGNLCGCGRKGCLEAYASGTAIGKRYARLLGRKVNGAKEVAQAAGRGEKKALQAFKEAGIFLGTGLATILNVINPEMVVFGGGVFKSAPSVFLKSAYEQCRKTAWPEAYRSCAFKKSVLRGTAGDLGALALVFLNRKN